MIEAFVVGLIGSTLGVVVGIGIAYLLRLIFSTLGLELGEAGLVLLPRTIAVAYVVGILVTLLAAYLPARRAARVPPVAAMRTDVTMQPRSLRLRGMLGAIVAIGRGGAWPRASPPTASAPEASSSASARCCSSSVSSCSRRRSADRSSAPWVRCTPGCSEPWAGWVVTTRSATHAAPRRPLQP